MSSRSALIAAVTLATSAQFLFAQSTISVHSGSIQYTSGAVTVGDLPLEKTSTNVLSLKNGDVLATGADGSAEVLMTPGVFVRLVGNSSLRMDSIDLADTRVTVLTGSVMVECVELMKENNVTFFVSTVPGSPTVEIRKPALFRIDAEPAKISVLQGQVFAAGVTLTKDKTLALAQPVLHADKFKVDKQDDLFLFTEARSADSAYASNVASHSLYSAGGTCLTSSWYWMNPVSMYAYLPCSGFNNFFGYPFVGVNYGYLYDGIPYYYPPPVLVCRPGKNQNGNGGNTQTTASTAFAPSSSQTGSNLMRVPAFTSVLSTNPTYLTVSRASYAAHVPELNQPSSNSNVHLTGPSSTGNRYLAATSLSSRPVSHGASFRGAQMASYSGGGSRYSGNTGGGGHYSGGGSTSSAGHSSGGSFSGGSFGSVAVGGHSSGGGGGHH